MSDVDKAMAMAVAAAEKLEGGGGGGEGGSVVAKGPTGPPRQSLARPKVSQVSRSWIQDLAMAPREGRGLQGHREEYVGRERETDRQKEAEK